MTNLPVASYHSEELVPVWVLKNLFTYEGITFTVSIYQDETSDDISWQVFSDSTDAFQAQHLEIQVAEMIHENLPKWNAGGVDFEKFRIGVSIWDLTQKGIFEMAVN